MGYDAKIVPLPDASFRWFERSLLETCRPHLGPKSIREILRQCWRDIHKETPMPDYDQTNTGIISKNTRKEKDNHPDITGKLNVEGVEYFVDGWLKKRTDGSGTFYSLKIKRRDQQQGAPAPARQPPRESGETAVATRPVRDIEF